VLIDTSPVGVLPDAFRPAFYGNVAMVPEIWLPLGYRIGDASACRDCLHLQAVGRLKTDAALRGARAELDALVPRLIRDFPDSYPPTMRFIAKPLQATLVGATPTMLWLLFAAAGLVLLIACVDVGNLILVRAQARERELAVRRALGAGRSRLARLLLCESVLLAGGGGLLATLVAFAATRALLRYAGASLPTLETVTLDGGVLLFAALLSFGVALLTGLWPALRASRLGLDVALRSGSRASGGTQAVRAEHPDSCPDRSCFRARDRRDARAQFRRAAADPVRSTGPDRDERVSVVGKRYDDPPRHALYEHLLEQVRVQPGVTAASVVNATACRAVSTVPASISRPADSGAAGARSRRFFATPGYFATMRIPC
jgi:hypothetical protein